MFDFDGTLKRVEAELEKEEDRLIALEITKTTTMKALKIESKNFFYACNKQIQITTSGNKITFLSKFSGSVVIDVINSTNFAVCRHRVGAEGQALNESSPAKAMTTQELSRLIVRWTQTVA